METSAQTSLNLTDKNGIEIFEDDILFDGTDYHRIYTSESRPTLGEIEMICCTLGYTHNIKQSDLISFERIGSFDENKHLLECD